MLQTVGACHGVALRPVAVCRIPSRVPLGVWTPPEPASVSAGGYDHNRCPPMGLLTHLPSRRSHWVTTRNTTPSFALIEPQMTISAIGTAK